MKKNILTFLFLVLSSYLMAQFVCDNKPVKKDYISSLLLEKVICKDPTFKHVILEMTSNLKVTKRLYLLDLYTLRNSKRQDYYFKIKAFTASQVVLKSLYYYWEYNNIIFLLPHKLVNNIFETDNQYSNIYFLNEESGHGQVMYDFCYAESSSNSILLYHRNKRGHQIQYLFYFDESGTLMYEKYSIHEVGKYN